MRVAGPGLMVLAFALGVAAACGSSPSSAPSPAASAPPPVLASPATTAAASPLDTPDGSAEPSGSPSASVSNEEQAVVDAYMTTRNAPPETAREEADASTLTTACRPASVPGERRLPKKDHDRVAIRLGHAALALVPTE